MKLYNYKSKKNQLLIITFTALIGVFTYVPQTQANIIGGMIGKLFKSGFSSIEKEVFGRTITKAAFSSAEKEVFGRTITKAAFSSAESQISEAFINEISSQAARRAVLRQNSELIPSNEIKTTYRLISAMPETAEQYSMVFKKNPTSLQLNTLERGNSKLLTIADNNAIPLHKKEQIKDIWSIGNEVPSAESTNNFDIIIGHSDGNHLNLPDGQMIAYDELFSNANRKNNTLVVISCKSERQLPKEAIGIKHDIKYLDSLELAEAVKKLIEKMRTCDEFLYNINQKDQLKLLKKHIHEWEKELLLSQRFGVDKISFAIGGGIIIGVPIGVALFED